MSPFHLVFLVSLVWFHESSSKVIVLTRQKSQIPGKVATEVLQDWAHLTYYGYITMGTPKNSTLKPQKLLVQFDTGSPELWVITKSFCNKRPSACKDHRIYDPLQSSTFFISKKGNRPVFTVNYVSGSISGPLVIDNIEVAGLRVKRQQLIAATKVSDDLVEKPYDGILGLGMPEQSVTGAPPALISMVDQGLIKQPVFALYFTRDGSHGELFMGGVDRCKYSGNFVFANIPHGETYYMIPLDKVLVNHGKAVGSRLKAMPDSGSSLILGPAAVIDPILRLIAPPNKSTGLTSVDCSKVKSLPTITFVISGHNFDLGPEDYIYKTDDSPCLVALQAVNITYVSLGVPFMTKYYTQFDIANRRLGFAPASHPRQC